MAPKEKVFPSAAELSSLPGSAPSKTSSSTSVSVTTTESSRTSATTTINGTNASAGQTSPQETRNNVNNRIDPGAVAGIAIGCLVAGIFVGICVAWLLQRFTKRRPRHRRAIRIGRIPKVPDTDSPQSMESSDNKIKVENFILQATPDREIVGMLRRLEVIMEQHIENYYHVKPIDINVSVLTEQLMNLGINQDSSGFEAEAVAEWCLHPASRRLALQHVVSHVLFNSIDWNSRNGISLLPGPAINFLPSIQSIDKSQEDFNVMPVVLTKWRTLSALLLHPNPSERTPLEVSEHAVRHQTEALVKELDPFLHCFVTPDQDNLQKQCHHMHSIIVEAAKLGYALFSHTSDWRFIYKDIDIYSHMAPPRRRAELHVAHYHESHLMSSVEERNIGEDLRGETEFSRVSGNLQGPENTLRPANRYVTPVPLYMIPPAKLSTTSTSFPEVHTPAVMAEILPAVGAVAGALRVTYQLITLAIESSQVSDEVRRSLELVRTCERDLQHLVGLREEYLDILERKPIELDRVNTIIRAAHQGLAEVCKIVEKCRPEANQGRIPFKRRSRWIFLDSTDFYTQIPVVSGHHRAVLNEISFLRQIALQAPVPVQEKVQDDMVGLSRKRSVAIDNIALLGNIMGGKSARRRPTQGNRDTVPDSFADDNNAQSGQPLHSSVPPPYRATGDIQSSVNQRSWSLTPETIETQFDQGYRQEMPYNQQRYLNSADIQATRRIPSTPHNAFWHTPLPGSSGLHSNPPHKPRSPYLESPPYEDQYTIPEFQAMPQTIHLDSLRSRPLCQNRGESSFSQYSDATCQDNASTFSLSGNEVESLCSPASQAQPPVPLKLPLQDSV
ncbi:hypothetical protein FBEOM_13267 [Fusarium beomiforme]|uniref:Uncharacterized protein n=1 Tax=Fusarium beomiforme TaxID=44412 RepID=A0A9P5DRQ9_9HYPO|nr:hypothetical protein FBEOM_13267 [Fusarium beomiforme]